jgi:thiol-activated cytolysin
LKRESRELQRNLREFSALSSNMSILFPGSVVKARGILSGALTPVALPLAESRLTLTGLQFKNPNPKYSIDIPETSVERAYAAIMGLLQQGPATSTATMSYSYFQGHSVEQLAINIGASWQLPIFSGEVRTKFNDTVSRSVMVVRLVQPYYTVSVASKASPSRFFSNIDVEDLSIHVGPGNPPMYLSDVQYGRMFVCIIRSQESPQALEAAVKLSFGAFVDRKPFDTDPAARKILNEADITLISVGGPAGPTVETLTELGSTTHTDRLKTLLMSGKEFSVESPGAPIAYSLRYLASNNDASITLVAPYHRRTWEPYRWTKFELSGQTFGEGIEPGTKVTAVLTRAGQIIASGNSDVPFGRGQPWTLQLSNAQGEVRGRDVNGSTITLRMETGGDDWKLNLRLIGVLENGQQWELVPTSQRHELNDDSPITKSVQGLL